jgi:AraC family transcriptional regulator of arabinose operon
MASDPRIHHIIALIEQRRDAPPSLAELARAANLSQAHLTRLFRRETGTSPAAFSRALRLDHARSLLQTSFLTVKQVMAASGWSDPSHFSREFSRRHGQSPLAFRRHAASQHADDEGVTEQEIRR